MSPGSESLTTWVGASGVVTVPIPSWLAPPLPEAKLEAPPLRVSVPPPDGARLYASLVPPIEVPLPAAPEPPPPPPYPDLRAEYAALQAQLSAVADCVTLLRRQILEASEEQIVRLACAVGERVAGAELQSKPELIVGWVKEAIDQLAKDESVVVAVSPDIAASLRAAAWESVLSPSVRIETDAALGTGRCEVRGIHATVDASLAGRAEAITRDVVGSTK
jgi:vacuolar-type H+-ATPase subunit E/Vma4